MSDSKSSSSRMPPSGKYVMPRSRYLSSQPSANKVPSVNVASRRTVQTVSRTQTRKERPPPTSRPWLRPRSTSPTPSKPKTEVSTVVQLCSDPSKRQSSPKQDRCTDVVQLIINDSVASTVLPPREHGISPRHRSFSDASATPDCSLVSTVDDSKILSDAGFARATQVAQAALHKRMKALLAKQTKHHLHELETKLTEIEHERDQLIAIQCAKLEWEHWLKTCSNLCAENKTLASIQRVLLGTENWSDDQTAPEASGPNFLERMKQFTQQIAPLIDRLPLRGIQLPNEEMRPAFERDLQNTVATAKLFSEASEREIEQLELLAESAERFAEHVRTTTVPQTEVRTQQIQKAIRLLAHEASLRFEQIQRNWLSVYQQRSN